MFNQTAQFSAASAIGASLRVLPLEVMQATVRPINMLVEVAAMRWSGMTKQINACTNLCHVAHLHEPPG